MGSKPYLAMEATALTPWEHAAELNAGQRSLLRLIGDSGNEGCLIYGRGPNETATALERRGLVRKTGDRVDVIVMGKLETKHKWRITAPGEFARAALETRQ